MKKAIVVGVILCLVTNSVSADAFGTGDNQFTINFVNISGDASCACQASVGPLKNC